MHMDKIFVNKGDHVKKGDIIGTVGVVVDQLDLI